MGILDIDNILKNATNLKKENSEDIAIEFLILTVKDNDLVDYDLIRLLQKIKTYAKKASGDTKATVIDFYAGLVSQVQNNNKVNQIDLLEEYADLLFQLGKFSEAEMYFSGAIASANPYDATNYLYKASQLYKKRATAILASNRNTLKKSIDYLYYHLGGHLLTIAWHLFVDGKSNIMHFISSNYTSTSGFKHFEIFQNIKNLDEESKYPFDNEPSENAFKIISKGKDIDEYCLIFKDIAFRQYPEAFGFKEEFLNPSYNDLKKFATSFANENNEINFETFVPSKAGIAIDDFLNGFIKQVCQ
jgi:tetratricopeptide (TPR) repeat protein